MEINLTKYYQKLYPVIAQRIKARPIMILTQDKIHIQKAYTTIHPEFVKENGDYYMQAWNEAQYQEIVTATNPAEIHIRNGHFFETELRDIIFDLDAEEASTLDMTFSYGKALVDWIQTNKESEIEKITMIYTGNRGNHIRCLLKYRKNQEQILDWMDECTTGCSATFIGKVDKAMANSKHFCRMPMSYNTKGQKFSFCVDKLKEFNKDIAEEKSQRVYEMIIGG